MKLKGAEQVKTKKNENRFGVRKLKNSRILQSGHPVIEEKLLLQF